MRTVIARFRKSESDLLSDIEDEYVATEEGRQYARKVLVSEFEETSYDVANWITEIESETHAEYGSVLEKNGTDDLDILSSASPIESGIVEHQRLLPSRAYAVTATEDLIDELLGFEQVERIHPNYIYEISHPEDMDILSSQSLSSMDEQGPWSIERLGVRAAQELSDGDNIKVAVLDTGIDMTHPEFNAVNLAGFMEWDELGVEKPSAIRDTHKHGTHVTGILCGANVGIATGIDLYVGLIAPRGWTTFAQINSGIDWATRNGVDILTMSVGKPGYQDEMEDFVEFATKEQVLMVAAIGNAGPGTHRSPGDYRAVLSVGATDRNDKAWVSKENPGQASAGTVINLGALSYRKPDIYAPGADIRSCVPKWDYKSSSGTSMAAPAVAGVAALVKSRKQSTPLVDLRNHLLASSDQITVPAALGGTGLLVSAEKAVSTI